MDQSNAQNAGNNQDEEDTGYEDNRQSVQQEVNTICEKARISMPGADIKFDFANVNVGTKPNQLHSQEQI